MGSCRICKKHQTKECLGCIHYEGLKDLFEAASPEFLAMRAEGERRAIQNAICDEKIYINLPASFVGAFGLAKKFACGERGKFMSVYVRDNRLTATNTMMIGQIRCEVPPELDGKSILRLGDGYVAVANKQNISDLYSFLESCLTTIFDYINEPDLDVIIVPSRKKNVVEMLALNGQRIYMNEEYYHTILGALDEVRRISYGGPNDPIIFESELGRALLMPVSFFDSVPDRPDYCEGELLSGV